MENILNFQSFNEKKKQKEPCWKGYKQVGMKEKDGKKVPNCVPDPKNKIPKSKKQTESMDLDVHDIFMITMNKLEEQGRFTKIDEWTNEFVLQEFVDESGLSVSELEKYADFDDDHIFITINDDENTLTYTNDY